MRARINDVLIHYELEGPEDARVITFRHDWNCRPFQPEAGEFSGLKRPQPNYQVLRDEMMGPTRNA